MALRWSPKPGRARDRSLCRPYDESRVLSRQEVALERAALAADMLNLMLADAESLAPQARQTVRKLYAGVLALRRQLHDSSGRE
jgi:hypothetical protein